MRDCIKNTKTLVSIIVPLYNKEKLIKRCIDSLLTQTYPFIEVIVIDDGSTDRSAAICDDYAKKDGRVKIVHKTNEGVAEARNSGMSIANGEFIMFVDADDYVKTDYVETYIKFAADEFDMVIGYANDIDEEGRVVLEHNGIDAIVDICDGFTAAAFHYVVWGVLYKAHLLEKLFFDKKFHVGEDTLFHAEALKRSSRVRVIPYHGYYYVHYTKSLAHGEVDRHKIEEIYAWQKCASIFDEWPATKQEIWRGYATRIKELYRRIIQGENKSKSMILKNLLRDNLRSCYVEVSSACRNERGAFKLWVIIWWIRYIPFMSDIYYKLGHCLLIGKAFFNKKHNG